MLRSACLISLLIAPAVRGELLWPLEQAAEQRALSSSFCEDRGSHLHGGVDMSTGGEVGVPVLAVADGAIVRIKVKYRGLGRAVYVQHPDGLMSVYGHLAGFAEPVRARIDALIARKGLYPGDWFPDEPIPVKAGQVIAWSGKTGGGPPHLHFETRRSGGNRPVDPWSEGLPCIDSTPPVIHGLSILRPPLLASPEPHPLPSEGTLLLDGSELLRVRVADPFGAGTGFVRKLSLSLDGRTVYDWDAASYTYPITRFAGHAFSRSAPEGEPAGAPGSWVWLNEWSSGSLPFVTGRDALAPWALGPEGTAHSLEIEAIDGCGNRAVERIHVRSLGEPSEPDSSAWTLSPRPVRGTLTHGGEPDESRLSSDEVSRDVAVAVARVRAGSPSRLDAARFRVTVPADAAPAGLPLHASRPGRDLPGAGDGLRKLASGDARPHWLPLARKAKVSFTLPEGATDTQRLGVYRWNPAIGSWQFWGDDVRTAGRLGTTTDRLGSFALLEDASPPRLLSLDRRLVLGRPWRPDAHELVVRYAEVGEGIAWDGLRFRPAGSDAKWTGVHDPDLDEATFVLPKTLHGRRLTGTLLLEDLAGHRVEIPVDLAP
jgi:hypothetical protein